MRRAHAVDVTGLYVLSEAEGGESGDVADIMESKRLQAEADLLGHYEEEDDDDEDNDEEGVYAGALVRAICQNKAHTCLPISVFSCITVSLSQSFFPIEATFISEDLAPQEKYTFLFTTEPVILSAASHGF